MTEQEIREMSTKGNLLDLAIVLLKEIAAQLARMNERAEQPRRKGRPQIEKR